LAILPDKSEHFGIRVAACIWGHSRLTECFVVTLPLISQALLSFTLSIDDLVLSAFLSGRVRRRCRWSCSRACGWSRIRG